ncbi:MAG: EthD family reductase [Flavobacteriaceae bacterium]|nr:EthD family reductase [Flavobacteriaceae bacterium]
MKKKFILIIFTIALFSSCQQSASPIKEGMVKIAIMYPSGEGHTFDMDYYSNKHMPMCAELFGDAMKHMAIDDGMAGRTPEDPIPYVAVGYFYFDQLSDYENAFGPNSEAILGDIPNYTNIRPVVQISKVVH